MVGFFLVFGGEFCSVLLLGGLMGLAEWILLSGYYSLVRIDRLVLVNLRLWNRREQNGGQRECIGRVRNTKEF